MGDSCLEKGQSELWGIWDDSPDLYRSIALSDGLISDPSSIAALYETTNKPILIRDVDFSSPSRPLRLMRLDMNSEGRLWAIERYTNALFELDLLTDEAEIVALGDESSFVSYYPYGVLCTCGKKVLAFPYLENAILEYDTELRSSRTIALDDRYRFISKGIKGFGILKSVEYGGNIYGFGCLTDAVVVYSDNGTVRYDTEMHALINAKQCDGDYLKYPVCMTDSDEQGNVLTVFTGCDSVMRYNLVSRELHNLVQLPIESKHIVDGVFDGNSLWVFAVHPDAFVRIDLATGGFTRFNQFPSGYSKTTNKDKFKVVDCGAYLLLLPYFGDMIVKFDKATETMTGVSDIHIPNKEQPKFEASVISGGHLYIPSLFDGGVYDFEMAGGTVAKHVFSVKNADDFNLPARSLKAYSDIFSDKIFGLNSKRITESSFMFGTIEDFLSYISSVASEHRADSGVLEKKGTAGQEIYEYVKGCAL